MEINLNDEQAVVEALADVSHEIWAHWMEYFFSTCDFTLPMLMAAIENGSAIVPTEKVERWQRQMKTPYAELTEREKASDREQAYKIIKTLGLSFNNTGANDNRQAYFSFPEHNLTDAQVSNYAASLHAHIAAVHEAAEMLGVPREQYLMHDLSKWSMAEFPYYARKFYGDGKDADGFKRAWLHHLHHNPHHWQHWILTNDDDGIDILEMPEHYALEMVADWIGASVAYTGSDDMTEWLTGRGEKLTLHDSTRSYVNGVLESLGYSGDQLL